MSKCKKSWRDEIKDVWIKIPADLINGLIKIIVVGFVLWVLSLTPCGSWLRCNFLDTNGCLPLFTIKSKIFEVTEYNNFIKKTDEGWKKGKEPTNKKGKLCVHYSLTIKNKSHPGRGGFSLKWSTIKASVEDEAFMFYYRLKGERGELLEPEDSKHRTFKINSEDFTTGNWIKREYVSIDFIIIMPKDQYDDDNPNIFLTLECDVCQISYQTKRI